MASSNCLSDDLRFAREHINNAPNLEERQRRKRQLHGMLYGNPQPLSEVFKFFPFPQPANKENPMAKTPAKEVKAKPATRGTARAMQAMAQEVGRRAAEQAMAQAAEKATAPREKTCLERAHAAVHGSRQENYGDQLTNFTNIADRMTITLRDKLVEPITPQDVALLMLDVKMARLTKTGGKHKDTIDDVAGYAECLDILNQQQEAELLGQL